MAVPRNLRSNTLKFAFVSSCVFCALFVWSNGGFISVNNNAYESDDVRTTRQSADQTVVTTQPLTDLQQTVEPTTETSDLLPTFSHPLENVCKYPILKPDDVTLRDVVTHPRDVKCNKVQEDYLLFNETTSLLTVNQTLTRQSLGERIACFYRPFEGTLKPNILDLKPTSDWISIDKSVTVDADQFETHCHLMRNKSEIVYRFAFAQIGKRPGVKFADNNDKRLSVDILVLDSTSLNMFRRHMPKSLEYMKTEMEFFHLEGYNKVADNSMVNLLPVLSGMRYLNASYKDHWLPSELPENELLDMDVLPFIWKDFALKGCPTMFNDDVMHFTRGIFHYPWEVAKGFKSKPTDYFFRPWHVWHRRYSLDKSSKFCFGNTPYVQLQLKIIEQMIRKYERTCHFSFSFITDLPHDDPSNLERMDEDLYQMLHRLYTNNHLNNTALIIMGDHGHRIHQIMYKYVGRIEERMSMFSIYFPEWFRKRNAKLMENLKYNKNRLTSNYDVHRMLKDIVYERFDDKPRKAAKGISLFNRISPNRTCIQANIPDNHCTCLERVVKLAPVDELYRNCAQVVLELTRKRMKEDDECRRLNIDQVTRIQVLEMSVYTTSQMIQHGVRTPTDDFLSRLQRHVEGDVEYVEVLYDILPFEATARIRLQHNKQFQTVLVNSDPLLDDCNKKVAPPYCRCFSN